MGKEHKPTNRTASTPENRLDKSLAVIAAQKLFLVTSINMGWQLALMVLVPIFIGVKLDNHFDSTPSYTLLSLAIAIGGAIWVVLTTIKQVGREQAITEKKGK